KSVENGLHWPRKRVGRKEAKVVDVCTPVSHRCVGCTTKDVSGPKHVSTSFVESQNFAVPLNYFAYNFIKIHRTLRMSPAMAAGVTEHLWDVNDLVALWESYEHRRAERAA